MLRFVQMLEIILNTTLFFWLEICSMSIVGYYSTVEKVKGKGEKVVMIMLRKFIVYFQQVSYFSLYWISIVFIVTTT